MISAVEQVVYVFGAVGVASIVAWVVAAGLIGLFVCGLRRSSVCWTALAAAIAGLVLANINSNQISAIQIDFSEEIHAAKERAKEEAGDGESRDEEADPDKASTDPDAPNEAEVAGQAEAEQDNSRRRTGLKRVPDGLETRSAESDTDSEVADAPSPDGKASDTKADETGETPRYAYREQGRVERTEGMAVKEKDRIDLGPDTRGQSVIANFRVMKTAEVAHANRLDRFNLFFARLTLTLAILVVVVDYFRRFNMTFRSLFPLPLGGPLIDSFFPKTHAVCVGTARKRRWRRFLKRVVRKGETFIYFGDNDPYATWQLGRIPLLPKFVWPLNKITRLAGDREFDDEFLFESAWFGRYCFVILDDGQRAAPMLAALAEFLRLRHATRAAARHTVNVIWNLSAIPAESTLKRLAALCPETNFKLLVAIDRQLTETQKSCFDEIV